MHLEKPRLLMTFFFFFFIIIIVFFFFFTTFSTCDSIELNDDVLGLIVFKSDLIDKANALSTWTEDEDSPCSWTGITCNGNSSNSTDESEGRVISINLNGLGLSGRISKRGLQKLTYLKVLSLAYNNISGSVDIIDDEDPYAYLERIDLSYNQLSGAISPGFGSIGSLKYIDFSHNLLSGSIPSEFFVFSNTSSSSCNLVSLSLAYNGIEGSIPASIALCLHIRSLDLSRNLLTGKVPAGMKAMDSLSMLDLSYNSIAGELILPSASSTTLVDVRLQRNFFQGEISEEIGDFANLEHIDLSSNFLSGELPDAIQNLGSLSTFNVANNIINGTIPSWVGNLASLKLLNLSYNTLQGSLPPAGYGFSMCGELQTLDLSSNKLSTSISPSLADCSSLIQINLARNRLEGNIPSVLGDLKHLELLDLSNNNLSGSIPAQLGSLQNLVDLNLSYNQLQGTIPTNGAFSKFNASTFQGNAGLCGDQVNRTCGQPNVVPKPMVLNPNSGSDDGSSSSSSSSNGSIRMKKLLSVSAILAISAAAAICAGIVIIAFLNRYTPGVATLPVSGPDDGRNDRLRRRYRTSSFSTLSSGGSSLSDHAPAPGTLPRAPAPAFGKLVMFTKSSRGFADDPRAEEWITAAHALLATKDKDKAAASTVYKAVLADGRTMAIKRLVAITKTREEFEKEVKLLGKVEHPHLLSLRGFYWTPDLQLLIYDFLPNGNLYTRLHEDNDAGPRPRPRLGWRKRFGIALGAARGLAHLHHACHPQIIHYNMKSSNILLDAEHNPKIVDHGLAKLLPMLDKYLASGRFNNNNALGYMAPEFASRSSMINEKCDVYGFGVILLELITGRRPIEYRDDDDVVILSDFVRALLDGGNAMACVDPSIVPECREEDALSLMKLGLMCTSQVPSNRPSMVEVVRILEFVKTPWANTSDTPWQSSEGVG